MNAFQSDDVRAAARTSELVLRVVVPISDPQSGQACVASLAAQSEPGWELGSHWEIVVVDSARPPRIPGQPGLRSVDLGPLPSGWTPRAFACSAGAHGLDPQAGTWLLFTEADSVFSGGAVSRAIVEADRYGAGMLSYGPYRHLRSLAERTVLPLVLSELASAYPAAQVNNPERRLAFADSHFMLLRAEHYEQLGGYQAVAGSRVPEVDLAFLAKRRKVALRYRYAPDAVSAASSTGLSALWHHWTPLLAVLIDDAPLLAIWRALDVALVLGMPLLALHYSWNPLARFAFLLLWARTLWRIYRRAGKSNARAPALALSPLGLPVFIAMLMVSWYRRRFSQET